MRGNLKISIKFGGVAAVLQIALLILKLFNIVDWPWLVILSPILIWLGIVTVFLLIVGIVIASGQNRF